MTVKIRKCNILRKIEQAGILSGSGGTNSFLNAPGMVAPRDILARVSENESGLSGEFTHRRFVLKIILSGKVRTMLDGRPLPMCPGDGALFFPYQVHATRRLTGSREPYRFAAVTFVLNPEEQPKLAPLRNRIFRISERDSELLVRILGAQRKKEGFPCEEAVSGLAEILSRHVSEALCRMPFPLEDASSDGRFLKICEYIRNHFSEPVSVKSLSMEFNVSSQTVRRIFKRHFDSLTPSEMLRKLRIQQAMELLSRTEEPAAEIARKCGFSNPYIFSSAFKRACGVSPLGFRKRS